MMRPAQRVGVGFAIAAYVIDQASKAIVNAYGPDLQSGIEVLPVFNLVFTRNRGVSFGLLSGLPGWGLVLLGLLVVTVLSVWLWRTDLKSNAAAIGLAIGGALGNIADRSRFGDVTDFLDFHLWGYHWPAFNFADVAIVGGLGLLLLQEVKRRPS